MQSIKVLGAGCSSCHEQLKYAKEAAKNMGLDIEVEYITDMPKKKQQYVAYLQIMSGRKSFSKTDIDATFMRMKEDHMKNGQLR